ncbi:hypothetical protein GCM10017771_73060 [Streptomyces capitiformicae]|uniref:Uncharacterized protein n=1 Tax=Streptomyces capitiformicae TaxID=2014920 RepID=A0A919DJF0_9ACTN|nr:hypothetical protein GCM10017771_73060 [Streptomyces capitiformicae]
MDEGRGQVPRRLGKRVGGVGELAKAGGLRAKRVIASVQDWQVNLDPVYERQGELVLQRCLP